MNIKTSGLLLLVGLTLACGAVIRGGEPIFVPVKIDGPKHDPPNHSYRYGPFSECASVLDMDGDGDLDIAAGRNWYEAPDWTKHENFRDGAETNGPETDNNNDIVTPSKAGLYVFYNEGFTPTGRPKQRLPLETTYPSGIPCDR